MNSIAILMYVTTALLTQPASDVDTTPRGGTRDCGACVTEFSPTITLQSQYAYQLTNYAVTTSNATLSTYALALRVLTGECICFCPPVDTLASDSDSDASGNLQTSPASASSFAILNDLYLGRPSGRADASATLLTGFSFARASSHVGSITRWMFPPDGSEIHATEFALELASAILDANANRCFQVIDPMQDASIDVTVQISIDLGFIAFCDCIPAPTGGRGNPTVEGVAYVKHTFDYELVPGTPVQQDVIYGLYGRFSDGSVSRLGIFQDAAFTPDTNGLVSVTNFPVSSTFTLLRGGGANTDVVQTEVSDSFGRQTADLNRDGAVCPSDRAMMCSLIGAVIPDSSYTPRGDFDLDGDIDTSDMTLFMDFFADAGCAADLNCDGVVDVLDNFAFTTAFNAGDFLADITGDCIVDVSDFFAFITAFSQGCN